MKKKSFSIITACFVFFLSFAVIFNAHPADAKEVLLRLAVPAPPGDFPLTAGAEDLAAQFNKRANGAYKIEVFAGGSLLKVPEYFDSIRVGAVEIVMIDAAIFSFLDPKLGCVGLPFLLNNIDAGIAAADQLNVLHDALFREKFNSAGLGMFCVGGVDLISNKTVVKLDQWKGLLVGAGSPMTSRMFKELGASPVTIAWTDLYESLQKGVVDSTGQVVHGALMTGLFDVSKEVNLFFGQGAFNNFLVNLDVWNKMPREMQTILQEEIDKKCDWMKGTMRKLEKDDIKALKEKGIKVNVVSAAERARWADSLAAFNEQQIKSFGEFGANIKKIADQANVQHPYKEMTIE